jgi:hypothetical protein
MADKLIATIEKNKTEEIRVSLSTFNGYDLANIRVWFRTDDGDMRPGKAGLAIRLEKLPAVIQALTDLEAEAHHLGLLDEVSP